MDMVPTIFEDVYIIKHPGYNIAYWNMMQRNVEIKNNKIYSNGKPAYFIHFSGFSPDNMENVSKHQNRFILKNLEKLRKLFELYRDLLVENDYLTVKNWKCVYDYFDNGVKIPNESRKIYSESISRPQTAEVGWEPRGQEEGCSATQQFNPEPDKVYLVSYTRLPRRCGRKCWLPAQCQVAIFLETPTGMGKDLRDNWACQMLTAGARQISSRAWRCQ